MKGYDDWLNYRCTEKLKRAGKWDTHEQKSETHLKTYNDFKLKKKKGVLQILGGRKDSSVHRLGIRNWQIWKKNYLEPCLILQPRIIRWSKRKKFTIHSSSSNHSSAWSVSIIKSTNTLFKLNSKLTYWRYFTELCTIFYKTAWNWKI